MVPVDAKRRLIWHGVLLFVLGLLTGAIVSLVTTPRLGLSAHLGGVMDGMFLILLGLIWTDLKLSAPLATATFWLQLYAAYAGWVPLVLAAVFGTSRSTPIAGAGHVGLEWQENLVLAGLVTFGAAILAGCGLLLYGLRRGDSLG